MQGAHLPPKGEQELRRAFFSARFVRVLDALGECGWLKALRLEGYAPRRPRRPLSLQQALFPYAEAL